jgi:hypothetical protein
MAFRLGQMRATIRPSAEAAPRRRLAAAHPDSEGLEIRLAGSAHAVVERGVVDLADNASDVAAATVPG